MNTLSRIQLALCCSALIALAVEPSAALLENDAVKVSRALEKAHVKGSFHEHKPNRVMIYLQPGRQRFEYQDGRPPAVFDWKAGQVVWSKADGMHSPEVVSDDPFNIIEVELKKRGTGVKFTGPQDSLTADPKHYTAEFENDQVRVLRMKLGAHEVTPMIAHPLNRLVVFLTPAGARKAGEVIWEPSGTYKDENPGVSPVEMVAVEVKE